MKWFKAKLGDLCEVITKGTTPRTMGRNYVKSGIPFLRAENLKEDEIFLDKNTLFIDKETDQMLLRSRILPGDVLLSIAGTIGRVAIVTKNSPTMNCNQAVAIIRIARQMPIENKFLLYWFKTPQAQSQIYGAKVTLTISNLSLGQIKELQIPLPPLSEQRRIVEILDQADALRRKQAEAAAKADRILPALFIKMFGDPATNPMGWEIGNIGNLAKVQTGGTPSRKNESFYGGSISWVKTTEVNNNVIYSTEEHLTESGLTSSNCKIFPIGTIIVAMYGQGITRGRSAKLGIEAATNQACAAILPGEKFVPDYLWEFLKMSYKRLRDLGRGGNQPNLNLDIVKNFNVFIPPIEMQKKFLFTCQVIDNINNQRNQLSLKMDSLFNLILERAFSGELTAKWREAHMKEILAEMEAQAKAITDIDENEQLSLL